MKIIKLSQFLKYVNGIQFRNSVNEHIKAGRHNWTFTWEGIAIIWVGLSNHQFKQCFDPFGVGGGGKRASTTPHCQNNWWNWNRPSRSTSQIRCFDNAIMNQNILPIEKICCVLCYKSNRPMKTTQGWCRPNTHTASSINFVYSASHNAEWIINGPSSSRFLMCVLSSIFFSSQWECK